jgi:hypothetical protein
VIAPRRPNLILVLGLTVLLARRLADGGAAIRLLIPPEQVRTATTSRLKHYSAVMVRWSNQRD